MATTDPTLPVVKNMVLLDSEGKRIAVKYYSQDWPTVQTQSSFERSLWDKTSRTNARQEAEIVMFDDYIIVYKYLGDLMFYVTGSVDENELILFQVLTAFFESISIMLRQQVEKKTVLENLDLVLLAMDELIDGGIIVETEPVMIASRATMRGSDEPTAGGGAAPAGSMPMLAEKSLANAFLSAKEHLTRSLLR